MHPHAYEPMLTHTCANTQIHMYTHTEEVWEYGMGKWITIYFSSFPFKCLFLLTIVVLLEGLVPVCKCQVRGQCFLFVCLFKARVSSCSSGRMPPAAPLKCWVPHHPQSSFLFLFYLFPSYFIYFFKRQSLWLSRNSLCRLG